MGKIVIWNSEICFGHMLYCMFTVLALLAQKALNDGSSLAGKDIKPMGPKAQGGKGGTFSILTLVIRGETYHPRPLWTTLLV